MARTILIVDDEPHLLRLLVRVFEREGHRVLAAATSDEAVELFREHEAEIEAVVLDVIVPPGGAAAVLEEVLARRPDLGLVLTSGDQPPAEIRPVLERPGATFLRKPFLPDGIVQAVTEVCAARSAAEH